MFGPRALHPPPYEGIRGLAFVGASAAAAGAYLLAGLVGLSLASVHASASPVWPPTGIAIASFLLLGPRVWPAIGAAAFVVNVATSGHVPTSLAIAAGNTLEGLAAARLVRALAGGADAFARPGGIGRFVLLGAGVATMVSATVGATALCLAGLAPWSAFQPIWTTWWLGDAMGAIVVTPALVLWLRAPGPRWSAREAWEAAGLAAATLAVGFGVFTSPLPLAWAVVPLVIWAALRFTTREAATIGLALNAIAVWGLAHGLGPFHEAGPLVLQGSVTVTSLVGLFLGAVTMERREAESAVRASRDSLAREVEARTAKLARSEERLKEAQRVSGVGSWDWDVRSDNVRWSEELYRIYGVAPGTPATYDVFLSRLHPDDRERVDGIVHAAFATGVFREFDHRIVRPDGEVRWLHSRGSVVRGEAGGVVSMHGTAQDVTEAWLAREAAIESERKFRTIFDASPIAIAISRPLDGRILEANEAFASLVGRDRGALVGGVMDDIALERVGRTEGSRDAAHASFDFDARIERPDGSVREVLGSDVILRIDGETCLVCLLKDVTEARRAEAVARQASMQAKEIQALREMGAFKSRFINMAAHELNTPLTPIKLQLHLLRRAATVSKEQESLDVVLRNFDRMATLIQNMLDVGRIQSGRMPLRRERLDLAEIVAHVERSFADLARERGIRLRAEAATGLLVEADRARVEQVLFNLVGNAMKFTPAGGEVHIGATREGESIVASVRDTGVGLDERQREALFQPFSQVHDGVQTSGTPGVGLGLFISREFAELHGGSLSVESEGPGRGSTFLLRLPAFAPAAAETIPGRS